MEATRSVTVRVDLSAPAVPSGAHASALSTTSVEVGWDPSTDAFSGIASYRVYRDGVLIVSPAASITTFADAGLTPGQQYAYRIAAVDAAGNASGLSATVTVPAAAIWLTVSKASVTFPITTPGSPTSVSSATILSVGGVGGLGYDLTCSAPDFANENGASSTPTMPIGALGFATRGWAMGSQRPLKPSGQLVDSSAGSPYVWTHDYIVDLALDAPWTNEPGVYSTTITYTLVEK